ncbi:MFS transporter [Cohnella faecalis]|uniref:hypothetical protein n=1 Tax=Cohnella faecalis TaxID=2315694 RepID=UPI001F16B385|nr:hypothetical protein [Cohnella faecalis]
MNRYLHAIRQMTEIRAKESASRRSLRISLLEGLPASILANLLGGPLQTLYLTYLGFSAFHIGLVLAIPPFTLLIQIAIAFAMQKWQDRRFYITLFAVVHRSLWVATGLIPLFFPEDSWVPIYIALWLLSMASGQAAGIIWTSLMADVVPPSIRGKYFGIRNMNSWAVICFTLLAGGQIMEWLPGAEDSSCCSPSAEHASCGTDGSCCGIRIRRSSRRPAGRPFPCFSSRSPTGCSAPLPSSSRRSFWCKISPFRFFPMSCSAYWI